MDDFQENLSSSSSVSSSFSSPNPDMLLMDPELWLMAEQRTQEILWTVQPNITCDRRRKQVINYLRTLIIGYFGTEVLAFGSVPLKTYLPDGDIDLTAFTHQHLVEDFAKNVCSMLKCEINSEFQVKDVQYINAQVKVVKCTVKNIPVDISFNQMAGLCTLCFLEQASIIIGKDHLYKRSIILIKAWCYYDCRILGAHHGLISTYALETLVLYIVNAFCGSLHGPLEVFFKFLQYYSTFDWENYCITINGPVPLSSLPEVTADGYEDDVDGLILSMEFLNNSRDMFALPIRAHEVGVHEFPLRRLNILDPLNNKNNLGRSVSKGNFYRMMSALSYGARKLREILMLPGTSMGEELEKFFWTTLDRIGRGERPDSEVPVHAFGTGRCEPSDFNGDYESYHGGLQFTQFYHRYALAASMQPAPPMQSAPIYSYVWDMNTLTWTQQLNVNGYFYEGMDAFCPMVPFYDPGPSPWPPHGFGTSEACRTRGTGTYIPEIPHDYNNGNDNNNKKGKKKNPEPSRHALRIKSAERSIQVDNNPSASGKDQEIQDENRAPPNFSLEEFPLLQATTKSKLPAISRYVDLPPTTKSELPEIPKSSDLPPITESKLPAISESGDLPLTTKSKFPANSESVDLPPTTKSKLPAVAESGDLPSTTRAKLPAVSESGDLPLTTRSKLPAISESGSLPLKSIQFLTFKPSPSLSGMPSASPSKQAADPVTAPDVKPAPYAAVVMRVLKKVVPLETREKRKPREGYELGDSDDFPPLKF